MLDWEAAPDLALLDQGVAPGGLKDLVRPGVVSEWDTTANRVRVSVDGGSPQWMPGLRGFYAQRQWVWVLRNPVTSKLVLCLGPTVGNPAQALVTLTAMNTTTVRATVTWNGVSYSIPYIPGTYTVSGQVWALLDPSLFGAPSLVLGPASLPPPPVVPPPAPPPPQVATTVQRTTTIFPEWSGTWRADQGRWNQWNVGRNGADALWQGSGYGANGLTGLATYGNRVTDLNAISLDRITATMRGADASAASYPNVVIQGSPNASQPAGAPSSSGDTSFASPGRTGVSWALFTGPMCEGFRTGAFRGLCLVGPDYAAVRGTGAPDGMALEITYTVPA